MNLQTSRNTFWQYNYPYFGIKCIEQTQGPYNWIVNIKKQVKPIISKGASNPHLLDELTHYQLLRKICTEGD